MKKNNFKKILVVFSLCVFLLSMFSISSFALNISDVHSGYLYKFTGSLTPGACPGDTSIHFNGYIVDKESGNMTSFTSIQYGCKSVTGSSDSKFYFLNAFSGGNYKNVVTGVSSSSYDIYVDYSNSSISKSELEAVFSQYWDYTVSSFPVRSIFNNVNIALNGGTNGEGVAYDGLLGMISKFGKFLVNSPLLLVLCIALPLVSFSVGLIIRIKNRA